MYKSVVTEKGGKNNLGWLPVIQSLSLLAGVQAGVINISVNFREETNVKFRYTFNPCSVLAGTLRELEQLRPSRFCCAD